MINPITKMMMEIKLEGLIKQLQRKFIVAETYIQFSNSLATDPAEIESLMIDIYKLSSEVVTIRQECYIHNCPELVTNTDDIYCTCQAYLSQLRLVNIGKTPN